MTSLVEGWEHAYFSAVFVSPATERLRASGWVLLPDWRLFTDRDDLRILLARNR